MQERLPKSVMIRTLPFTAGNYGGILQAYALQRVIGEVGADVFTDTSTPARGAHRLAKRCYRKFRLALPSSVDWRWRRAGYVNMLVSQFVRAEIRTEALVERANSSRGRAEIVNRVRTVVVGSDQVWRAAYAKIPTAFLDFLRGAPTRRVSYAASFGRSDLSEYSSADRVTAGDLLRRFDAVSVRESDAVEICEREWGVQASQHLDPTMLLTAGDYRKLFEGVVGHPERYVAVYALDHNPSIERVAGLVSDRYDVRVDRILPPEARTFSDFRNDPSLYRKRPVENWLATIAGATFVVTDSFHGCVFAILFNRPFVVVENQSRGTSRIASLLALFGLEANLVRDASNYDPGAVTTDWRTVNAVLESERGRGLEYLQGSITT